jgi:molybdopterin converting factor small subunit
MADVTVRFWAGAARAAGHDEEPITADTVGGLRTLLGSRPALQKICVVASLLVDGQVAGEATKLHDGAVVDVLPPFAGG